MQIKLPEVGLTVKIYYCEYLQKIPPKLIIILDAIFYFKLNFYKIFFANYLSLPPQSTLNLNYIF